MSRFTEEVAFVTGAASGISRSVALSLAAEGARVACIDINASANQETADGIRGAGGTAIALNIDVSDSKAVNEAVKMTTDEFGKLSVLINGAALIQFSPLEDCDDDEWDRVISVGLSGYFYTLRAAYPHLVSNGGGSIVQISSSSAKSGSSFGGAHYTAAKGGVVSLTKYAARRWAKDGIRVNTVCPGITDTGIGNHPDAPKRLTEYEIDMPFGHVAKPEEISDPILFLASDEARHITGITLDVNGGREIYGN